MPSCLLYSEEPRGFWGAGVVVCCGATTGTAFPFSEALSNMEKTGLGKKCNFSSPIFMQRRKHSLAGANLW